MEGDPHPAPPAPVEISRRAMLTHGGAAAAGAGGVLLAGAAVALSGANGRSAQAVLNVRDFGATGDGKTDDTASLQRTIVAARPHGGIVYLPPGTYLTQRLVLYSLIHLRGSGADVTTLKLKPGANSAILESDQFSALTGTGGSGGITMFSIRDLTLDGNKAQNDKGGYGLRVYGYGYELTEIAVVNCHEDGVFSEWGPAGALPEPSRQMESRLTAVRAEYNNGSGINFLGPHDSMFLNCLSVQNLGAGFRLAGDSAGTSMVNCHAWGMRQNISFDLAAAGISCLNCYADLNGGIGLRISRSDCRWLGGLVLGYNHPPPAPEIGIQFLAGEQVHEPAGVVVDTKIMNCGTAAVDFGADRGLSSVRAVVSQPGAKDQAGKRVPGSGLSWMGQPHPTTQVEITEGLGNNANLVVRPAFDLRAQTTPPPPSDGGVRVFARTVGGKTQLCALFAGGAVQVLATEP
jgi:hypothetical protein